MTYTTVLPAMFPHCIEIPDEAAADVVRLLMERTPTYQHGSSFAITADLYDPLRRCLWMSKASWDRLAESDLGSRLAVNTARDTDTSDTTAPEPRPEPTADTSICEAVQYAANKPCSEQPPKFAVVYRSAAAGKVLDQHAACFTHGMAEVDRHTASAGMARCGLEEQSPTYTTETSA